MKKITLILITALLAFNFNVRSQVFITELADPNNASGARFVELYNAGATSVDLSTGWQLQRATNGNSSWQSAKNLTGTIPAGGFYVVCSNQTTFTSTYGFAADQSIGTGGPADSNGDDQIRLLSPGAVAEDMFGVLGEDGSGTNHEFEDGRAERKATVTSGNTTYTFSEWNIWNDTGGSGTTNDPRDAPNDFDPGAWIGAVTTVSAPTFNPGAGSYIDPVNVSISCITSGATIYYTTDGSDPDNTSSIYTAPINIATATTLKAFAVLSGEPDSPITTGAYSFPVPIADMATLRIQTVGDGSIYQLNSEAILTYQQSYRGQKYIQDGTAGILIDDNDGKLTTTYAIGDGITGIYGKLGSYNGMLQFIPQVDAGAATSTGNVIIPVFITVTEFVNNFEDYEGQVVKIDYLTFADAKDTFYNGNVYPVTDNNSNAMDFRTTFYGVDYIGTIIPPFPRDIVGIANEYYNNPYLTARNSADITNTPAAVPLGSTGIIIAVLLITAVLVIRRGKLI